MLQWSIKIWNYYPEGVKSAVNKFWTLTQKSASSLALSLNQRSKSSRRSLGSVLSGFSSSGLCSHSGPARSSESSLGFCVSAAWLCCGLCTTTLRLSLTILHRRILSLTTCCPSYSTFYWPIRHHLLLPGRSSVAQSSFRCHAAENLIKIYQLCTGSVGGHTRSSLKTLMCWKTERLL